jgi:hypothetical protein
VFRLGNKRNLIIKVWSEKLIQQLTTIKLGKLKNTEIKFKMEGFNSEKNKNLEYLLNGGKIQIDFKKASFALLGVLVSAILALVLDVKEVRKELKEVQNPACSFLADSGKNLFQSSMVQSFLSISLF